MRSNLRQARRRRKNLITAACLVGLFAFVYFNMGVDGPPLEGDALSELLSGATLSGKGYSIFYDTDGSMRGNVHGYADAGRWWVDGDRYCVQWELWGEGEPLCWQLWRDGKAVVRKSTKSESSSWLRLVQGER